MSSIVRDEYIRKTHNVQALYRRYGQFHPTPGKKKSVDLDASAVPYRKEEQKPTGGARV